MEITVRNLQRREKVDRRRVASLAGRALTMLDREESQLAVVFVSDRKMQELNRHYRGVDAPTDVLAFSQLEGDGPRHPGVLGDVVISAERAALQARSRRKTLEREIDLLVVHGILHLAGLDHAGKEKDRKNMQSWQRKILRGWDG